MAWCRWSTDIDNKHNSDLYIYEHYDEYIQVHVTGRRRSNYANNPTPSKSMDDYKHLGENWTSQFIADGKARQKWFEANEEWETLPKEYSGLNLSFDYGELDLLVEWLKQARINGINFPDYVFDIIRETAEEQLKEDIDE